MEPLPTNFESMIDATNFRTVAAYLRGNLSPIRYLLHAPDRETLISLAELLEFESRSTGFVENQDFQSIEKLIQAGKVKMTLPGCEIEDRTQVPLRALDPEMLCYVIWFPPFYIAFAPDLNPARSVSRKER